MKILILAAGYGTRLYPLVKDTPKPLLDISGRPLIDYILDQVRTLEGLTEVFVVTNNKFFEVFQEWTKTHGQFSVPITVVNDGTRSPDDRLGSVGDIHFVIQQKKVNEDLLVIGGDNLFDEDFHGFFSFAKGKSPHAAIGVYDIHNIKDASKFGVVDTDKYGKIISFEEKPEKPKSSLIAMCVYYFPQPTLGLVSKYLGQSHKADKAGDYIKWISSQGDVYAFQFRGKWYDIGSIESYKEAQEKFVKRERKNQ